MGKSEVAGEDRTYRFGFVVEYTIGHVTFARMLESAVAADPAVEARWVKVVPGKEGWPATVWPLSANYSLRTSAWARRLMGRPSDLDALFFHTQSLTLFSRGAMRRVPSVVSLDATPKNVDELAEGYGHPLRPPLVESAKQAFLAALLGRARYLMAWNERCARSLVEDYHAEPGRVRIVRPGIDLAAWRATREGHAGPLRVLFVGGDFERKGGPHLLEALRSLSGDWECDLVTRSDVRPNGKVRVHRSLEPGDPELRDLYWRADVFVLPTAGDASPWAVVEAMASGLPVVATDVGGVGELLGDGRPGILVAPGDVAALAAALRRLEADPGLREEMGEAARARAAEAFDEKTSGQAVLDLLKSAVAGH